MTVSRYGLVTQTTPQSAIDNWADHSDIDTASFMDEPRCRCHGKTEAELARPYALFVFSLPVLVLTALVIMAVVR